MPIASALALAACGGKAPPPYQAVLLASVGGAIGLGLGIGVSKWMAARGNWPTLLSPPVMLGTMLAAGLAGIVAGFYPALRASRLDPIEALRFE